MRSSTCAIITPHYAIIATHCDCGPGQIVQPGYVALTFFLQGWTLVHRLMRFFSENALLK